MAKPLIGGSRGDGRDDDALEGDREPRPGGAPRTREQPDHRPGILPSTSRSSSATSSVRGGSSVSRQAGLRPGRPPRRRAQLERVAADSRLSVAGQNASSRRPWRAQRSASRPPRRVVNRRQAQAVPVRDGDAWRSDPAARPEQSRRSQRAAASSRASAPREQRAPREVDRQLVGDARRAPAGGRSAAATTKSAFGRPPRCARPRRSARGLGHRRGGRVDADDEGLGLGRARAMTARPSPVPRSMTTRSDRAIQ